MRSGPEVPTIVARRPKHLGAAPAADVPVNSAATAIVATHTPRILVFMNSHLLFEYAAKARRSEPSP
jgi:hypothetical protein